MQRGFAGAESDHEGRVLAWVVAFDPRRADGEHQAVKVSGLDKGSESRVHGGSLLKW